MTTKGRFAAIDIGTVTCRLLVADVDSGGAIDVLRQEAIICNLGLGIDETGKLAPESIERAGSAIEGFVQTLGELRSETGEPIHINAVATSALRDAENATALETRLAQIGLEFDVIPGQREAELSFSGASSAFGKERVVVIDVGGGSTEIITGRAGGKPERAHSFNVGCRRVTDRFFRNDPPGTDELEKARTWIDSEFTGYLRELHGAGQLDGRLVAVAGTATSIVSMREKMSKYDSTRVHGSTVYRIELDEQLERLAHMTIAQRRTVVGLDPDRAPVIVAGLLILERIMHLTDAQQFTVSESDILHGIILDAAR